MLNSKKNLKIGEMGLILAGTLASFFWKEIAEGAKILKAKVVSDEINHDPAYQYGMKKEEEFREYLEKHNFDYISNIIVKTKERGEFELDFVLFEGNTVFVLEYKSHTGKIIKEGDNFCRINKFGEKQNVGKLYKEVYSESMMFKKELVRRNKKAKRIYVIPVLVFDDETDIESIRDFNKGIISVKDLMTYISQYSKNFNPVKGKKNRELILKYFRRYSVIFNDKGEVEKVIIDEDKLKLKNGVEISFKKIKEIKFVKKFLGLVAEVKYRTKKGKIMSIKELVKDYEIKVKYHYKKRAKSIYLRDLKLILL